MSENKCDICQEYIDSFNKNRCSDIIICIKNLLQRIQSLESKVETLEYNLNQDKSYH